MRYCGSKARFMKELAPILMEHVNDETTFIDCFMGGANVISYIEHDKKVGIELNKYVYALWGFLKYKVLKDGATKEDLHKLLVCDRDTYNKVKESYVNQDHVYPDWYIGFVGTCCSYGGAWMNGYAAYNPKKGEDHIKEAVNGLLKQLFSFKSLKHTIFVNCSYDKLLKYPKDCVIYCDPPYAMTKKYESDFDHAKFWDWVRMMSKRKGTYVYVSEYEAPDDFKCIWQKEKKDGMGSSVNGISKTKIEKLFVYDGKD